MDLKKLSSEELSKAFIYSPKEFFEGLDKLGINVNNTFKNKSLGKDLVKRRFNFSDETLTAIEFIFWISYVAEKDLRDIILSVEQSKGLKDSTILDSMLDKLTFHDKITIAEEHYAKEKNNNKYLKLLRTIKDLRNHVAHGKFDKLMYDGVDLTEVKGQLKLLADLTSNMRPLKV